MKEVDLETSRQVRKAKVVYELINSTLDLGYKLEYRSEFAYKRVGVLVYECVQKDDFITGNSGTYSATLFSGRLSDRLKEGLHNFATQKEAEQAARDLIDEEPEALSDAHRSKVMARQKRDKACGVGMPHSRPHLQALDKLQQSHTDGTDDGVTAPPTALMVRMSEDLKKVLTAYPSKTARELATILSRYYKLNITKADVDKVLQRDPNVFASAGDSPVFWYCLNEINRPVHVVTASLEGWCDKLVLWPWQRRALNDWESEEHMGVVEAVTGTGKTRVGIAAAAWCASLKIKTLVLVPTADLQRQWCKELASALPHFKIGSLGDGDRDTTRECDILVATVQSACRDNQRTRVPKGLIIADECHRYGAETWSQALKKEAYYRLGLTATYERLDDGVEEHLGPYFGGACYRLNYEEALRDNIIAHFKIALVGVRFTPGEQARYDEADEIARKTQGKLINEYDLPESPFGAFIKEVKRLSKGELDIRASMLAGKYLKAFTARRSVLAEAQGKLMRLEALRDAIEAARRTIVFTQTTKATQQAVRLLRSQGLAAASLSADLKREERTQVLDDFDTGETMVVAAPKLLDEGIDVPEADLGIIIAASRTRLQMIQRMGRVLRKKDDGRLARVVIMYVEGTSEDPNQGAHEAFLDLITPVASDKRSFSPAAAAHEICEYLNDW